MGIGASLVFTQLLRTALVEVNPRDLQSLVVVSLIVIGVSMLACYLPTRRARRVDPIAALRGE